jgi:hypothetical protein
VGEAPAHSRDDISGVQTVWTADWFSRGAFSLWFATVQTTNYLRNANLVLVFVYCLDRSAVSLAAPRPNTDNISYGSSERAGTGLAEHLRDLLMAHPLSRLEGRPGAPRSKVQVGAGFYQQLRRVSLIMLRCGNQGSLSVGRSNVHTGSSP